MSSSESTSTSDTEYPDHVHECLKYVPIYRRGAFSCGSSSDGDDDDDDYKDEDVRRILAGHNGREPDDRETVEFSSAYEAAAAAAAATCEPAAAAADDYEDWDEAARDASAVYPPLGPGDRVACSRSASAGVNARHSSGLADDLYDPRYRFCFDGDRIPAGDHGGDGDGDDDDDDDDDDDRQATARELRKCLEGALYGQDLGDFVVAQPFCVADKNLDFGKSKMSQRAVRESRKKVENWMSRYVGDEDATNAAYLYH